MELQHGQPYTIVVNTYSPERTCRKEAHVMNYYPAYQIYVLRIAGCKEMLYAGEDNKNLLIFEGHRLPFVLDSERNVRSARSGFNFLTDDPKSLRLLIREKCLNLGLDRPIYYSSLPGSGAKGKMSKSLF
jgi:hypothetical protein